MKEGTVTWSQLPSGRERYVLESVLAGAGGVFGVTWCARDQQAGGARVAVKLLPYSGSPADQPLHDEYAILRDFTAHANIQQFYGVFCERAPAADTVWLVLELCEGGTAAELARRLLARERKLTEDHHAFIIKEVIKGTSYLHENKVVHRNICGSSILLTREGEVKLGEFGVSRQLSGEHGKRRTSIGSPGWMAPEVVCAATGSSEYGSRADVWALGITAIELADGKAPFQDMHPTRALFQIVRNPPPSLDRPSSWSNDLNDFIAECLEKNPEHRPFMVELLEHPCIQAVPENDYHLTQELKKLIKDLEDTKFSTERVRHTIIKNGHLLTEGRLECESLQVEDLAALDELSEDTILQELKNKLIKGFFTSYIGDILLILSPIIDEDFDSKSYHKRYECKSLADNAPHIFGVADAAYQRALHHGDPQHLVFCGESGSGKSTQALHALSHLLYLGRHTARNNTAHRVSRAAGVIRTAITAATPANPHSTRCIFQAQLTYGTSGKLSGAIFWVYQLERWRISSTDMSHGNFNLVYYFYDSMEAQNMLEKYNLESGRNHRYLRVQEEACRGAAGARDTASENAKAYGELLESLTILDWEPDDIVTLENILAAILVLGNVRFKESKEGYAEIENAEQASRAARLLLLEEAKFRWALLNYCVVERGAALKRRRGSDEARDARDALAAALYKRLVDFILHNINSKLAFGRSVFGDKYSISILDMFGFECFHRNRLEQLIVNTTNEQMQFLYNQRTFAWEMQEQREEQVPPVSLHFYDNKCAVDQLMGRPLGLFHLLDEASRTSGGLDSIMSTIKNSCKGPYIKLTGSHEFSVAHFAGKVKYDAREMADRNKDFLPPEMIETMRASGCPALQALFRAKLTRSGNLVCTSFSSAAPTTARAATKKLNAVSCGQYSQLHRMRTTAATYRATSLELLKQLAVSPGSGGTHFVKCVRAHLAAPLPAAAAREHFHAELVRHQMRALSILDTAKARQKGFSSRIPFPEFIRRYKFLAFDFDETVEESKDNCRLLLIRLKMEGWLLGSTKVFLKYYNEEFLGRLYERQVKKIVKVQCMMRAFLARRKAIKSKSKMQHVKELKKQHSATANEDEAALLIQKAYRGYVVRKAYGPLVSKTTEEIDEETAGFLKRFALKWKSRSIFQVLLQYRAQRYQDLVHFSQQVHIYNQCAVEAAVGASGTVPLEHVQPHALALDFLGAPPPAVRKLPFRIDQLCYHDTTHMCSDPHATRYDSDQENWDEPLKRRLSAGAWSGSMSSAPTLPVQDKTTSTVQTLACQSLIHLPFCRDPMQPITTLTPAEESPIKKTSGGTGRVELASRPPPVYKKKQPTAATGNYQPPTPWSGESKPARSAVIADDIPSPIKELQALAKASADLNPSGEAPFNFQAMLKRTPRNRASMKRSGESDDCVMEDRCAPPQPSKATSNRKPPAPTPTPVKRPAPVPPAAGKQLASAPAPHPHTRLAGPDNKRQPRKVQLVPGISVEGEITDL